MDKILNQKDETSTSIIIPSDSMQEKILPITVIRKLVNAIKGQIPELEKIEHKDINSINYEKIEGILIATDSLINDCYSSNEFTCNKNDNFLKLSYMYQRISIKLETYKLQEIIKEVEHKNTELIGKQNELDEKYNKSEEKSSNLVYNLLGFLASFSIVSAAVSGIGQIHGMLYIMIFILFTLLVLITTLIGLHNFYIVKDKKESKLQDNYFLWKVVAGILILLCLILPIKYIKDNKEKLFNYIDKKIENVIENKVDKELEN